MNPALKDPAGNVIGQVVSVENYLTPAMERLESRVQEMLGEPEQRTTWRGPRNLPKPDARKRRRRATKAARRANRA